MTLPLVMTLLVLGISAGAAIWFLVPQPDRRRDAIAIRSDGERRPRALR